MLYCRVVFCHTKCELERFLHTTVCYVELCCAFIVWPLKQNMSISQSDIIISPTVVPILVLISPWIPALSSWSFLLCLSCLWNHRLWSDHSREDASPHSPSRRRWYLHPYRCWRILSWKPREMNELLAVTDAVVLLRDRCAVKGRHLSVFIWYLWAVSTLKVEGGVDPEWHLFFTRIERASSETADLHREIYFMSSCHSCQHN